MDNELRKFLKNEGYFQITEVPEVGVCALYRFLFTVGLVVSINEIGYRGRYCYENLSDAKEALDIWDGQGDPPGPWIKYKGEGGERLNN